MRIYNVGCTKKEWKQGQNIFVGINKGVSTCNRLYLKEDLYAYKHVIYTSDDCMYVNMLRQ